jgi:hypothetical protein
MNDNNDGGFVNAENPDNNEVEFVMFHENQSPNRKDDDDENVKTSVMELPKEQ